jgi:hypothetical protein
MPTIRCTIRGMLALVTAVAMTACGASRDPRPAVEHSGPPSRETMVATLADAWVSDGQRGYFVDGAPRWHSGAMSLYRTRWNLRLAGASALDVRLDSARVAEWLDPAFDEATSPTGLPELTVLEYAVDVANLVGAPLDRARVLAAVERLRLGSGYRPGAGAMPNWGSNATAVRIHRWLGERPPGPVTAAARKALHSTDPQRLTPDLVVNDVVPQLEIVASDPPDEPDIDLTRRYVKEASQILAAAPIDAVWLSAEVALYDAAKSVGVSLPATRPAACDRLLGTDGKVRFGGATRPDPQATHLAQRFGCPNVDARPDPEHGRIGWPDERVQAQSLGGTVAAMRIAQHLGVENQYLPQVMATVRDRWLPQHNSSPQPNPADVGRLRELMSYDTAHTAALSVADASIHQPSVASGNAVSVAILMWALAADPPSPQRTAAVHNTIASLTPDRGPSMIAAASLELAARLLADTTMHSRAERMARQLRIAAGIYRLADNGNRSDVGSLVASAIGIWIEAVPRPQQAWVDAGFCNSHGCAESAVDLAAGSTSLRSLAAFHTCVHTVCVNRLPIPL